MTGILLPLLRRLLTLEKKFISGGFLLFFLEVLLADDAEGADEEALDDDLPLCRLSPLLRRFLDLSLPTPSWSTTNTW